MKRLLFLFLATALLWTAGCRNPPVTAAPGPIATRMDDLLSPGDVLRITFSGAPDLNQSQKIRPDGNISLPKVGEVKAAGKRPLALQNQLNALYKPSLQNAEVTVVVDSSSFPVIVLGAVNGPGQVNLDRPSLLQAIGKAGGIVRGLGDASRIRIIHEGETAASARVVNLDAELKGRSSAVIHLQRGDTVVVPEKWL